VRLPSCAILIPNWNGIGHLALLLPSLREAARRYPGEVTTVVVDNRSTEPDVAWIREHHPECEVVVAERNDFLFSLNPVAAERREDVVVVLNNDMRVDPDFLEPLVRHFGDPSVFAVMSRIMDWEGVEQTTGQRLMHVRRFWFAKAWRMDIPSACYSLEACGGASAYRRDRFVALGGYDPLFRPGYYEDLDLSYRAWQRGWRVVFEPASVVYHRVSASFSAHFDPAAARRRERFDAHLRRNEALFTIKNVGTASFLAGYLGMLPVRIARAWLRGDRSTALGLARAVPSLGAALRARRGRPPGALSTAQIDEAVRAPLARHREEAVC
jgi:N-acetylglucosaminyl-diphospho-decaprenol L-rhamnosyltransferase